MIPYDYIPQAEKLKNRLYNLLNAQPQHIHFVHSKADALISLLWFYVDNYNAHRILVPRDTQLFNIASQIAGFSNQFKFYELPTFPTLQELRDTVQKNDILLISNPLLPSACLMPIKRINEICLKHECHPIFDISLSFFWLGYDFSKTNLYPSILAINPAHHDSSPVAIISHTLKLKHLFSPVKQWNYPAINLDLHYRDSQLKLILPLVPRLDNFLTKYSLTPLCENQLPVMRTYITGKDTDMEELLAILQFFRIQHTIGPSGQTLTIPLLQQFDQVLFEI